MFCYVTQMAFVSDMLQPSPNPILAPVCLSQSSTSELNPTMAGPAEQSNN